MLTKNVIIIAVLVVLSASAGYGVVQQREAAKDFECTKCDRQDYKSISNVGGGKCLDVHAPDMRNDGGRVQVWECNGEPQQQW